MAQYCNLSSFKDHQEPSVRKIGTGVYVCSAILSTEVDLLATDLAALRSGARVLCWVLYLVV